MDKLLQKALSYVETHSKLKRALNIGPKDNLEPFLLESEGFMVDAVDKQFIEIPKESTVNFFHMYIEDFDFPHQYDFILARNVLYFLDKESLLVVFERCKKTLEKRGVYYFSVLGVRDEWVIKKDFCFFNKMEIMHIFAEYTCMNVVENEGWGTTYSGSQKYWHTLSFVFKK